jgi:hypothetical protein
MVVTVALGETRFDVAAGDGGSLAVWAAVGPRPRVDAGPHRKPLLRRGAGDRVTTYSMDRRGFGASADTTAWSTHREFADVPPCVRSR